jgi:hypothetical protein
VAGALLLGFGTWHVADALLSHWILGIHRIKLDSRFPLAWDLCWAALFGLVPMVLGRRLAARRAPGPGSAAAAVWLLAALSGAAGAWSLQEPAGQRFTTVVFAPGTGPVQVFDALESTGARLVWSDRAMGVVVAAAGCASWSGA